MAAPDPIAGFLNAFCELTYSEPTSVTSHTKTDLNANYAELALAVKNKLPIIVPEINGVLQPDDRAPEAKVRIILQSIQYWTKIIDRETLDLTDIERLVKSAAEELCIPMLEETPVQTGVPPLAIRSRQRSYALSVTKKSDAPIRVETREQIELFNVLQELIVTHREFLAAMQQFAQWMKTILDFLVLDDQEKNTAYFAICKAKISVEKAIENLKALIKLDPLQNDADFLVITKKITDHILWAEVETAIATVTIIINGLLPLTQQNAANSFFGYLYALALDQPQTEADMKALLKQLNPDQKSIVVALRPNINSVTYLQFHIIMPMQRAVKYPLLFKEIVNKLKRCSDNTILIEQVEQTLRQLNTYAVAINTAFAIRTSLSSWVKQTITPKTTPSSGLLTRVRHSLPAIERLVVGQSTVDLPGSEADKKPRCIIGTHALKK